MADDKIIISTENPEYVGEPVKFTINPSHLSVSQQIHKTFRKARKGHVKSFIGNGAIVLTFNGSIPLNPNVNNITGDASTNLKESVGWRWFEKFEQFARSNQAFLFKLQYLGTPIQINRNNPEFIGDLDIPTYERDADNHMIINYSFVFTCELVNDDPELDYLADIEASLTTVEV